MEFDHKSNWNQDLQSWRAARVHLLSYSFSSFWNTKNEQRRWNYFSNIASDSKYYISSRHRDFQIQRFILRKNSEFFLEQYHAATHPQVFGDHQAVFHRVQELSWILKQLSRSSLENIGLKNRRAGVLKRNHGDIAHPFRQPEGDSQTQAERFRQYFVVHTPVRPL